MKLYALILSLLLLSIAQTGESGPINTESCDFTCQASEYFDYVVGSTYTYKYDVRVVNSFSGTDQSPGVMEITAQVAVDIVSQCEHRLRITGASMRNGADAIDNVDFAAQLARNPLSFTRDDGVVRNLCVANDDPAWVTNIKRGILSAMSVSSVQDNVHNVRESDILGECVTMDYSVSAARGQKNIIKNKDLSTCVNSNRVFSSVFNAFSLGSGQNAIKQNQRCEQRVSSNGVQSVSCNEQHVLQPFSNGDGAYVYVDQQLQLTGQVSTRYSPDDIETHATTLQFEDEMPEGQQQNIEELQTLYSKICRTLDTETFEEVSQDYVKMIFLLRRLDSSAIAQAYSSLNGACPAWESSLRTMFMDALKWCGSEGCVTYGAQLISQGSDLLDDETSVNWLMAMSLIEDPTLSMVEAMNSILETERYQEQAYLTAGSLIHAFCSNSDNCMRHYAVRDTLRFFEEKIGTNCQTSSDDMQYQLMLALKAIGNAGQSNTVGALQMCAKETANSAETRVAAMQAFRRMSCSVNRDVESIVFDRETDSELRIVAYLTMMKCPTSAFISKITTMLDDEPSQQTASFVSTHLRALVASTDPLKGYIKPFLVEVALAKSYDMDPRKFSRFYEASYFSEQLAVGGTAEGSLVWSPRSFVPRSAAVNLTANVFGKSINVLEMGGRVEGVEKLLKDLMKPKKFLQDVGVFDQIGGDIDDSDSDDDGLDAVKKPKKSRMPNSDKLKEISNTYEEQMKEETLSASYYVRLFGDEMSYGNTHPQEVKQEINDQISSLFSSVARGSELSFHKNMALATWAYTIPTGAGLPLTVAVNASTSIDVRVNGQMDFSSLLSTTPEFAINTDVNPRATVVVDASMSVDAHHTKIGVMTESSMVSGWKVSGRASMSNGRDVQVRIDAPYQENNLFRFNHKLIQVSGDSKQPLVGSSEPSSTECTEEMLGHSVCFTRPSGPISIFPASGELTYGVSVSKRDAGLTHFMMRASYDLETDQHWTPVSLQANVQLDTPGSNVDRRSEASFNFDRQNMQADASVTAPGGSSRSLSGQLTLADRQYALSVQYTSPSGTTQLQGSITDRLNEMEPSFEVTATARTPSDSYDFATSASYSPMTAIRLSSSLTGFYNVGFNLGYDPNVRGGKIAFNGGAAVEIAGIYDNGVSVAIQIKPRLDNFAANVDYTLKGQSAQSIRLVHKNRDTSNGDTESWESEEKLLMTQFSDYNLAAKLAFSKSPVAIDSSATISYGSDAGSSDSSSCRNCVVVNQHLSIEGSTASNTAIGGSLEITIPFMSFEESIGFDLTHNAESTDANLRFRGEDLFTFSTRGNADKRIAILSPTPWGSISLNGRFSRVSAGQYELTGNLNFGQSDDFNMGLIARVSDQNNQKLFSLEVNSPNGGTIFSVSSDTQYERDGTFSTENSLVTSQASAMTLNLGHAPSSDGFRTQLHFDFQPYMAGFQLEVDTTRNHHQLTVMYNNFQSQAQEATATLDYSLTPERRGDTHFDASLSLRSTINELPFRQVKLATEYTQGGRNVNVGGSLVLDGRKIFDLGVDLTQGQQFSATLDLEQMFYPNQARRIRMTASGNLETQSGRLSVGDGREDFFIISATINMPRSDLAITNNYFNNGPRQIDATVEFQELGIDIATNMDDHVVNFAASISPSMDQITASLRHSATLLQHMSVPRNNQLTVSWGTRESDQKQGLWSTLVVDGRQSCQLEAMYGDNRRGTYTVDVAWEPNNVQVLQFLPPSSINGQLEYREGEDSFDYRHSVTVAGIEKLIEQLTYTGSSISYEFHGRDSFLASFLPTDVTGTVDWSGPYILQSSVTMHGTVTTTTAKATWANSRRETDAQIQADLSSNHPAIVGTYRGSVSFHNTANSVLGAKASLAANNREAVLNFDLDLNEQRLEFSANHNFRIPYRMAPYNVRVTASTSSDFSHVSARVEYNRLRVNYEHELRMSDLDLHYSCDVQQNLLENANNVRATVNTQWRSPRSGWSVTLNGTAQIDGGEMHSMSVGVRKSLNGGEERITLNFAQRSTAMYWMIPDDSTVAVFYSRNTYGFEIVNRGLMSVNINARLVMNADGGFTLDHSHDNGGVAHFARLERFYYSTSIAYQPESGRITASGRFSMDNRDTYTASSEVEYGTSNGNYFVNTQFDTNTFDLLGLNYASSWTTNSQISLQITQASGIGEVTTSIRRTFSNGAAPKENRVHLSAEVMLFNYYLTLSSNHDLEELQDVIPRSLQLAISASLSAPRSEVFLRMGSIVLTIDGQEKSFSFTYNYNKGDNTVYLSCKQNVPQLLEYGVPGNMSLNFKLRTWYDFDLNLVYDTSRRSVGFNFDWNGDDNKLAVYFFHNFDAVVAIGIPKTVGAEVQGRVDSQDASFNVRTVLGDDVRTGSGQARWEGENLATLRSVTWRHEQNFTDSIAFVPNKLRVSSSFTNNEETLAFDLRSSFDGKELKIKFSNEHMMGDYEISAAIMQNFVGGFPRRVQLSGTLNLDENRIGMRIRIGSRYKFNLSGSLARDGNEYTVNGNVEHSFEWLPLPEELELQTTVRLSQQSADVNVNVTPDKGRTNSFNMQAGRGEGPRSFFASFRHNMMSHQIPADSRLDVALLVSDPGSMRVEFVVTSDGNENTLTLDSSWQLTADSIYASGSVSHDVQQLADKVPRFMSGAAFLSSTHQETIIDVNVTSNAQVYTHLLVISYRTDVNSMKYGIQMAHDDFYLRGMGLPDAAALGNEATWDGSSVHSMTKLSYSSSAASVHATAHVSGDTRSNDYNVKYVGQVSTSEVSRDDEVGFRVVASPISPHVEARLHVAELQQMGVPSNYVVQLNRNNRDSFDWTAHVEADDLQAEVRAQYRSEEGSIFAALSTLHTVPQLDRFSVPRNMSVSIEGGHDISRSQIQTNARVTVRYDEKSVDVGFEQAHMGRQRNGNFAVFTNLNMDGPQKHRYQLGYSYAGPYTANGRYLTGGRTANHFDVSLNLQNGVFRFAADNTQIVEVQVVVDTSAFMGRVDREMTPFSIGVTYDRVQYSSTLTVRPDSGGESYELAISDGTFTATTTVGIAFPNYLSFDLTSSRCQYLPRSASWSFQAEPLQIRAAAAYRSQPNFSLNINGNSMRMQVVDLDGRQQLNLDGSYDKQRSSGNVALTVPAIRLDAQVSGAVSVMQRNGNNTIALTMTDNRRRESASLTLYATLSGDSFADIAAGVTLVSDLNIMPYNLRLTSVSAYEPSADAYTIAVKSTGVMQLNLEGIWSPRRKELTANMDASSRYGVSNRLSRGRDSTRQSSSLQWGGDNDRVDLTIEFSDISLVTSASIEVDQPSAVLGYRHFDVRAEADFATSVMSVGGAVNLDAMHADASVSYEGNAPALFGQHEILFKSSVQAGGSSWTPTAAFNIDYNANKFDVSLTAHNNNQQLLSITEEFSFDANSYNVALVAKQSLVESSPLRFFHFAHGSQFNSGSGSTSATMQLNGLPESRLAASFAPQGSNNYSATFDFTAGALSSWLSVRSVSGSGWHQQNGMVPSLSYTVQVDGDEYHLSSSNIWQASRGSSRLVSTNELRQPHRLRAIPIFKRNALSFELLQRRRGSRVVGSYQNEMMPNPVRVIESWRLNNGDVLLDDTVKIEFNDGSPDIDLSTTVQRSNAANGEYQITFQLSAPAYVPAFTLTAANVNSDGFMGADVTFHYEGDEDLYHARVTCNGAGEMDVQLEMPGQEPIRLRGNVAAIFRQAWAVVQEVLSSEGGEPVSIVYSYEQGADGVNMHVGLANVFGNTYTIHLSALTDLQSSATLSLYVQENDERIDVGSVSASLVGGQLLKLHLQANPVLSSLITDVVSVVEAEVKNRADWLADSLVRLINTVSGELFASGAVRRHLESAVEYLVAAVKHSRDAGVSFITQIGGAVTRTVSDSERSLQDMIRDQIVFALDQLQGLNTMLLKPIQSIVDKYTQDLLGDVKSTVVSFLTVPRQTFDIFGAGDLFVSLVEESIEKAMSYGLVRVDQFILAIRGPVSELVTVTNSEVVIAVPLAFSVGDVSNSELPTPVEIKEWFEQTALAEKMDQVVQYAFSYLDTFYMLKAFYYTPLREQLPPFRGHAFVADFKHFRTFDGRYYDFVSGCESSHVLAMDGRDGNFTIALTYGENPTYEVRVGVDRITFAADGAITHNNQGQDLPVISRNGLVALRVGDSINIQHGDDLSLSFDTRNNLLAVDISPFYFASTGGMLGMFDNEPHFDFVAPDGEQLDDVSSFAYAWEISDVKCSHENAYETSVDASAEARCQALYRDETSAFRPCYPVVPTDDFYAACMKSAGDYCKVAKAYQTTCMLRGALISPPNDCMSCAAASGGDLPSGRERSYDVTSVDVVVIVQESGCFKGQTKTISKFMKKFVKGATSTFQSMGKSSTSFYMVGYGGPGSLDEPHTYTMRDRVSSSRKSDISKRIRRVQIRKDDSGSADGMKAVMYATKLPFRAGAQQVFVHLLCDACSQQSAQSQSAMSALLASRNIVYHHLPLRSIETRGGKKQIYGYDSERSYVRKSKTVGLGQIVRNDADACVTMAENSGGAVWDANIMKTTDFVNVFSHHLTSGLPAVGRQTCSCQLDQFGEYASKCVYAN